MHPVSRAPEPLGLPFKVRGADLDPSKCEYKLSSGRQRDVDLATATSPLLAQGDVLRLASPSSVPVRHGHQSCSLSRYETEMPPGKKLYEVLIGFMSHLEA